jgi:hypothetical protein
MGERLQQWVWSLAALGMLISGLVANSAEAAAAADSSVDASIEPSQITLGESARLTYTTSGRGTLSVSLPVVSGLEFRVIGQASRFEFVNGAAISSTSTIIRVTPAEAGVFTIPGPTPKSPPLLLRVNPSGGGGPSLSNPAAPGLNPLNSAGSEANGIRLTPDGSAFVRLEVTKHELFVGESVPAEIQIGMRDGFASSINGLPKLNSSDFTLNSLSFQPERSAKVIDGKPFTVYSWHSLLSAIKPGTYTLTFEAPVTVRVRTQPRRDSILDDLLGDPFMQNLFGASVTKNLTVASPGAAFTVLPLPAEGKPADFGGAVGSFKITSDISSPTNTAGDPLTLRMHVNGAGTFDRVQSSMLAADAEWKTYQSKSTFSQSDPTGFRGEKTFEQPIIATQPGVQIIPALTFSYFDPGTRHYATAKSAPLRVAFSPSAADSAAAPPPVLANGNAKAPPAPAANDRSGLRPDHPASSARTDSLIPLYLRPPFLGVQSALALLFAGAWLALRRRAAETRDSQSQRERGRREAARRQLQQMSAATRAGNTALFFNSARGALQQILSLDWKIEPGQVTTGEVDARLGPEDQAIRQLFALTDEANYSGATPRAADFERWTELVNRRLKEHA